MTRSRSLLLGALVLGTLAIPASGAQAATRSASPHLASCSDSWKSPVSGLWGVPTNWSNGQIPGGKDSVCITLPGTYTVTLAPWSIGTADPNSNGGSVGSLTLGSASGTGTQTLDIVGQGSTSNSNEQQSTVSLTVAAQSTITAHGNLVLDSTNGGSTLKGNPSGGYAMVLGASFLNYGSVECETQAPKNKLANFTQFEANLVNEPHASVHDISGQLQEDSITNDGSFTVGPAASMSVVPLQGVYGQPASFTNGGALTNDGSITANQTAGTVTWTQAGGPIKGNEVVLGGGAILVDKSGAAQFFVSSIAAKITGTIPAGQKITVVGEAYNSNGDAYNGTTLSLDGGTVVNDGTIELVAQGSGSKSGGPAIVNDGSIRNAGTILAEVQDPSWNVQYQAGLANTRAGTLSVTGGTFDDNGGGAVTNDGTVKIGPRALYLLQEAAAFTNKSDGTIVSQIASTKSFGQFQLTSPCCSGPGRFLAGGVLLPAFLGQVSPANTEFQLFLLSGGSFKGTFARLAGRFTADYSNEAASPAFVGVIFDKSGKKPKS
jgi:hypothetical protein